MNKGWIKLYRQIQDCWIWLDDEPYDKRSAWTDLLLTANHSNVKMLFNGEMITIGRGQIFTSIRKLSARWKWSYDKTTRFLKLLERDGMLRKESDNFRTLLTIENYGLYQDDTCTNRTLISERTEHGQVNEPNADNSTNRTLISDKQECKECNNDKELKNDKNIKEKDITSVISKKKSYYPDDELLDEAFNEYLTMRKRIKKPICTDKALHRAMNALSRLSGGDNDLAVKILNQSVDHCWQGLFELKEDSSNKQGNQNFNKGAIDWDNV